MSVTTQHGDDTERLWSIHETADYLGVTVHAIYKWRHRGLGPPGAKVGRMVKFNPDDVREWVEVQKR